MVAVLTALFALAGCGRPQPVAVCRCHAGGSLSERLNRPITVAFADAALADVVEHLHRASDLHMVLDPAVVTVARPPLTLQMSEAPVGAVIVAVERAAGVRVVVRNEVVYWLP